MVPKKKKKAKNFKRDWHVPRAGGTRADPLAGKITLAGWATYGVESKIDLGESTRA